MNASMHDTGIPATPVQPPDAPKQHKHSRTFRALRAAGISLAALIVISGAAGALTGGHGTTATPAVSTSAPAAPAAHKATSAPATSAPPAATQAPAPQAPAAPAITTSQQQALTAAQSYLALGSGFSRAGLIAQLTSQYGSGFGVADATWAADHSGADWNAQAVMAAKGYMNLGTGFSRAGLIAQLDSPYGGQFTLAQATYAANQVGL